MNTLYVVAECQGNVWINSVFPDCNDHEPYEHAGEMTQHANFGVNPDDKEFVKYWVTETVSEALINDFNSRS